LRIEQHINLNVDLNREELTGFAKSKGYGFCSAHSGSA
jgi:hypothetical protein